MLALRITFGFACIVAVFLPETVAGNDGEGGSDGLPVIERNSYGRPERINGVQYIRSRKDPCSDRYPEILVVRPLETYKADIDRIISQSGPTLMKHPSDDHLEEATKDDTRVLPLDLIDLVKTRQQLKEDGRFTSTPLFPKSEIEDDQLRALQVEASLMTMHRNMPPGHVISALIPDWVSHYQIDDLENAKEVKSKVLAAAHYRTRNDDEFRRKSMKKRYRDVHQIHLEAFRSRYRRLYKKGLLMQQMILDTLKLSPRYRMVVHGPIMQDTHTKARVEGAPCLHSVTGYGLMQMQPGAADMTEAQTSGQESARLRRSKNVRRFEIWANQVVAGSPLQANTSGQRIPMTSTATKRGPYYGFEYGFAPYKLDQTAKSVALRHAQALLRAQRAAVRMQQKKRLPGGAAPPKPLSDRDIDALRYLVNPGTDEDKGSAGHPASHHGEHYLHSQQTASSSPGAMMISQERPNSKTAGHPSSVSAPSSEAAPAAPGTPLPFHNPTSPLEQIRRPSGIQETFHSQAYQQVYPPLHDQELHHHWLPQGYHPGNVYGANEAWLGPHTISSIVPQQHYSYGEASSLPASGLTQSTETFHETPDSYYVQHPSYGHTMNYVEYEHPGQVHNAGLQQAASNEVHALSGASLPFSSAMPSSPLGSQEGWLPSPVHSSMDDTTLRSSPPALLDTRAHLGSSSPRVLRDQGQEAARISTDSIRSLGSSNKPAHVFPHSDAHVGDGQSHMHSTTSSHDTDGMFLYDPEQWVLWDSPPRWSD